MPQGCCRGCQTCWLLRLISTSRDSVLPSSPGWVVTLVKGLPHLEVALLLQRGVHRLTRAGGVVAAAHLGPAADVADCGQHGQHREPCSDRSCPEPAGEDDVGPAGASLVEGISELVGQS